MCSDYWEKWKTICPEIQVAFEHKVAPDIDGFTDEPVVQAVWVAENTFPYDSK